jgi:hypothetical protein
MNVYAVDAMRETGCVDAERDSARRLPCSDTADRLTVRIDERNRRAAQRLSHCVAGHERSGDNQNQKFAHRDLHGC